MDIIDLPNRHAPHTDTNPHSLTTKHPSSGQPPIRHRHNRRNNT